MSNIVALIDSKCEYCNKKPEYFMHRSGLFMTTFIFICNEHRLLLNENTYRRFKTLVKQHD